VSTNNRFTKTLRVGGASYEVCDAERAFDAYGSGSYSKLPYSLRILTENIVRNQVNASLCRSAVSAIARRTREVDVPYVPSRVVLQDLLGTPALVDLAGLRDAIAERGGDPGRVNPVVPVHLVVDHSLNVEHWGSEAALTLNMDIERQRNAERFEFLQWCNEAFDNVFVIPSGNGILHQINLERLTPVIAARRTGDIIAAYPDTLVGTDSHTTMINAVGVLGWGVGGIEAEAAMLGHPLMLRLPEVIGVRLEEAPREGILATDTALALTEMLRNAGVVGAYLEFVGPGVRHLSVEDRATISNMAPEYGATAALFAIDDRTIEYLHATGRSAEVCELVRNYATLFGFWSTTLEKAEYDRTITVDLSSVQRGIAGPKHPHQLVVIGSSPADRRQPDSTRSPTAAQYSTRGGPPGSLPDGAVVIAAITSCTNTSNPRAVIAAGLLARRARKLGLSCAAWTKTSFAPGSKVVVDYLSRAGLDADLNALGFNNIGFGCTTCNGMSGSLSDEVTQTILREGTVTTAVLSGNRNFEGRIHPLAREAYIMSPPLVVAYAIAGNARIDLERDPLGYDQSAAPVFLRDLWPSDSEIDTIEQQFVTKDLFAKAYADVPCDVSVTHLGASSISARYAWQEASTYIKRPPYWSNFSRTIDQKRDFSGMRPLVVLGDHITTDHISPSGAIPRESDAGRYLLAHGVSEAEFNSYGTRRGNHEVAMRATFANPRLRNELLGGQEGPFTRVLPDGPVMSIVDAATCYLERQQPLIVIAGREYGSGSSRDWAAKGPRLLGVRVVLAESFERIHRANLACMGILPLQFTNGDTRLTLAVGGKETFDVEGINHLEPGQRLSLCIRDEGGVLIHSCSVLCRLDTDDEISYFNHGGLLPQLLDRYLPVEKGVAANEVL
jgi:aconitate hydratase 1